MTRVVEKVNCAILDNRFSPSQRLLYAWLLINKAKPGDSIGIDGVAEAMDQHRVTAGEHLWALEKEGVLERFIEGRGKSPHKWRWA